MQALKPDKSAGFPRGFVQARYNSSCNTTIIPQQQSANTDANVLSNYELHIPGGIYWNSEQVCPISIQTDPLLRVKLQFT
jgi:hypothetical protein